MITIFTTPKPFVGHTKVIQTNAIQSWLSVCPACEVILFGNEEGTAELASALGIRHITDIERNEYGTPLLRSVFSLAQNIAKYQLMCYVNADIILMSDFVPAVQRVRKYPFLMVGQRWDIELDESVNFDDAQWEACLRLCVAGRGKLHPEGGVPYFVFPRGLFRGIPPLAIGRTGEDNWLVYWARQRKVPVIDATRAVTAIHQNHDYGHHPQGAAGVWKGPESIRNVALMGGLEHSFTIANATVRLTPKGLQTPLTLRYFYHRLRAVPVLHYRLHFLLRPFQVFEKMLFFATRLAARLRR